MFAIDLHVHTQRYSPCAETLDPSLLGPAAAAAGLDGILLADHDVLWASDQARALERQLGGIRVYRGVEVSSAHGHFVVTGVDDLGGIGPGVPAPELVRAVHARGGVAILAHPHRGGAGPGGAVDPSHLLEGLLAVEVISSVTTGEHERQARALARAHGWVGVGGSDAHFVEAVGRSFTWFDAPPQNERELAAAIRAGGVTPARYRAPESRGSHGNAAGRNL